MPAAALVLTPELPVAELHQRAARLVEAHRDGDPRAFAELDRLYRRRLIAFLDRMLRDRARAEDLVQEALFRVHQHRDRFDRAGNFTNWVYTIAANLARNELRRRRRNPVVVADWEEEDVGATRLPEAEDPAPRPDDACIRRSVEEVIARTVTRLTPRHREVFVRRDLLDQTYDRIATELQVDLGTVKSRLNRARRAFSRMIAPHLD